MGLFKDLRGLMKDAKDLEQQAGGRPSLREGIAQAREGMAVASENLGAQSVGADEGLAARATIRAVRDTGITLNENPVAELDLDVESGGGPPYPVTIKQTIPRLQVGQIQPGREVEVRIAPGDPSKVTLA